MVTDFVTLWSIKSHDRSVGIALGYGLDDRGSRVRFPAKAGNFSLHHRVQTGSGAHPASYPMGSRGSFPGVKRPGSEADNSPPSSSEVKKCMELYLHSQIRLQWRGAQLKLSLCLFKHYPMKTYRLSRGIVPRILKLGARWRWVVSFTPRPLYPRYQLDRRLGWPERRSGRGDEGKNTQPCLEFRPARSLVAIPNDRWQK
jgi:hypothetical protein